MAWVVWFIDIISLFSIAGRVDNLIAECARPQLYNPREPLLKVGLVQVFHRQYPLAFFPLTNHVPVASCSNAAIRAMFRFLVRLDSSLLLNKTLLCRFFAFNLTIQVRRTRLVRTKFDAIIHQLSLNFLCEEFCTTVGLYSLYWKWHFLDYLIDKNKGVCCRPPVKHIQYAISRAVINSSILVNSRSDFACIHLHSITWNGSLVTDEVFFLPLKYYWFNVMSGQHLMYGSKR